MQRNLVWGVLWAVVRCGTGGRPGPAPEDKAVAARPAGAGRVYVTSFQSGKLEVLDLADGHHLGSIATDDGAGSVGFTTTKDGKILFVTDGAGPARLRTFDAATLKLVGTDHFANRELLLGSRPLLALTPAEDALVIGTFDYKALAPGSLVFDRKTATFTVGPASPTKGTMVVTNDGSDGTRRSELEKWLGPMDDPTEAGQWVYTAEAPTGLRAGPRGFVHGTRVWFVDRTTKQVLGTTRLPGVGHDAHFSADGKQLVTYVPAAKALVLISPTTLAQRQLAVSFAGNTPVDFLVTPSVEPRP